MKLVRLGMTVAFLVWLCQNAFGAGVVETQAVACPRLEQFTEYFQQIEKKNFAVQLPSSCVDLIERTAVDGPFAEKAVRVGKSTMTFVQVGVPRGGRLWIRKSAVKVLDAQARHALTVEVQPADASVRIMNIRPQYKPGIRLQPGRYDVLVEKPGYQASRQWVTVTDADKTLEITLRRVGVKKRSLVDRMNEALGDSVQLVELRGQRMVLTTHARRVEEATYRKILLTTCRQVIKGEEVPSEIAVLNRWGKQGWVYERPAKCALVLEPDRPPIYILGDTHLY